jgi:hypothetical protein
MLNGHLKGQKLNYQNDSWPFISNDEVKTTPIWKLDKSLETFF